MVGRHRGVRSLEGRPGSDTHRWYNYIKSFTAGMKQFAKASKDKAAYTAAGAAEEEDDDDSHLFRSDEEESEVKQKKTLLPLYYCFVIFH